MNPRPKKHLGQHFLTELKIAERLAAQLQPLPNETVVEIGPGKGVLTKYLIQKNNPVIAYEVDSESVEYLSFNLTANNLTVREADFLTADLPTGDWVLCGNLPYNISSPIFFRLLEERAHIREAVVMIQREVAQRICAPPGNKTYGILSVLLGLFYDCKYCFTVPPGVFFPPPKVDSAVLKLTRRAEVPDIDYNRFALLVKTAFGQRRKTLHNALKPLGLPLPPSVAGLRAEQLTIAQFAELTRLLA